MSLFFKRIHKADRVLSILGWLNVVVMFFAMCAAPWDDSALQLGANPWTKVIRYAAGLAIYSWTLAHFIQYLKDASPTILKVVRWGTFACVSLVAAGVTVQAMRGLPSHFNIKGEENAVIFAVISFGTLANSLIAFLMLFLFLWEEIDLPRAYLMGIRLGFVLFSIGSLAGMIMMINQAHTIGAADGGPGLPILEWSTKAGDLRPAHLAGIFGIQILPLAGWGLHRLMQDRKILAQLVIITGIAGLWVFLFIRLFSMAVAGRPLFAA